MLLFFVAAAVVVLDQVTKYLVASKMVLGESISLIRNFLAITYVRNPGAAFGLLPHRTPFLIIVTLLITGLIVYLYLVVPADYTVLRLGLALQAGGALGNLIDRVRNVSVVDFIDLKFFPPVFNVADIAVVIGVVIFFIAFWRIAPLVKGCPW